MKARRKLTESEIIAMESWAEQKRKAGITHDQEKYVVKSIEDLKKKDWKGFMAGEEELSESEKIKRKLDRLKRKG